MERARNVNSCKEDHMFMIRREVCSEALCVQAATRAITTKFIEVGRAKADFSLWERCSASKCCEHVL